MVECARIPLGHVTFNLRCMRGQVADRSTDQSGERGENKLRHSVIINDTSFNVGLGGVAREVWSGEIGRMSRFEP
jgi:hypothetical protein